MTACTDTTFHSSQHSSRNALEGVITLELCVLVRHNLQCQCCSKCDTRNDRKGQEQQEGHSSLYESGFSIVFVYFYRNWQLPGESHNCHTTRLEAPTPNGHNHNLRSYEFRACIVYFIHTHIGPVIETNTIKRQAIRSPLFFYDSLLYEVTFLRLDR